MKRLKVLILRPDNLGDVILFTGMLKHIRALYPQAEITLSVKNKLLASVELCPYIDKLIEYEYFSDLPLPCFPNIRGKFRINWWLHCLFKTKYKTDILLLPVRSPNAGIFNMHAVVSRINAHTKIGIAGDNINQTIKQDNKAKKLYSKQFHLQPEQFNNNELDINRDFLQFLGLHINKDDIWPDLWTNNEDKQWARNAIPLNKDSITLAISPGVTSTPNKFYPGNKYAYALSGLNIKKFKVILIGTSDENEMCRQVENELSNCNNIKFIQNLCGKTTIRQMIEGIRRCDALISLDTGALHVGVALKKPTVGIIGGGHFGRFYPWGDNKINRVANKKMECYWCNWNCIYPTIRCVQEIDPILIANELKSALKNADII